MDREQERLVGRMEELSCELQEESELWLLTNGTSMGDIRKMKAEIDVKNLSENDMEYYVTFIKKIGGLMELNNFYINQYGELPEDLSYEFKLYESAYEVAKANLKRYAYLGIKIIGGKK